MTPCYVNFDKAIEFESFEKLAVIDLGKEVPDEFIKGHYINDFYVQSRKTRFKNDLLTISQGQHVSQSIL